MARLKVKPDLSKESVGINPMISGLKIYTVKKQFKVINKFLEDDIKENDLEAIPYTKVFEVEGGKHQVLDLPIRGQQLYLWLIHSLSSAQDCVWIDVRAYMKRMNIKSVNTYKKAVSDLCDGLYIAPHHKPKFKDVYWINPYFFFKGSRINKYPDRVYVKKVIEPK